MASRWSNFKGFSRYKVSDKGRIYDRKLKRDVSQTPNEDGYLKVTLRNDKNKRKTFSVHRLVALCFLPNPDNLPEVNHKDGIKSNCRYKNLEWCTHAYNIQHAWDNNLLKKDEALSERMRQTALGKNKGADNHKARKIYCITTKEKFVCMADAIRKYKVDQAQLSKCCAGYKNVKSAGKHPDTGERLKWRYLDA